MTGERDNRELGAELRRIRTERGLSLRQLASRTGLSSSFLSLVENGESDIAFGRLQRILGALDAGLGDVLPVTDRARGAARKDDPRHLGFLGRGISVDLLTPPEGADILAGRVHLEPGGAMTDWSTHLTDEWLYVLEGTMTVHYENGEAETLSAGESVLLRAGTPHRASNDGKTESRALSVHPSQAR